jgi:hypothetical protein
MPCSTFCHRRRTPHAWNFATRDSPSRYSPKHILSIFAHPSLPLVRCSVPSWRACLIQRRRGWPQRQRYAIPVRGAARAGIAGGWSWRRAGTRGYCGIGIGWCRAVVIATSAYHLLCHERLARARDIANGECVGRVAVGVLDHNQVAARICPRPSADSLRTCLRCDCMLRQSRLDAPRGTAVGEI